MQQRVRDYLAPNGLLFPLFLVLKHVLVFDTTLCCFLLQRLFVNVPVLLTVCHIFDTLGLVVVICLGIAVAKLVVELAEIQGRVFEHPGEVFCLLHLFEIFVRP